MNTRLVFPDDVRPDFDGFRPAALAFLAGLARNNERGWFTAHRETYETEVRFPLECLVAEFRPDGAGSGLPVKGDPGRALFRIHRDVRFSPNKAPYKTHAGAVLSRTGGRGEPGVLYIHIEPGESFVSAGFWRPEPQVVTAWRRRMVEDPEEWLAIVAPYAEGRDAAFLRSISALKTLPRGFKDQAASPVADYLRWKSFLLSRKVEDAETMDRGLIDIIREHALKAAPLLKYGWELTDAPAEADPRRHMRAPRRR